MDIENIEICPHEIVKILNIMLAVEPETVLALIKNRPVVQTQELKDFLNMTGSRLSFIGVLNFFLKEKGSKY